MGRTRCKRNMGRRRCKRNMGGRGCKRNMGGRGWKRDKRRRMKNIRREKMMQIPGRIVRDRRRREG